jgi:N-acetylglucosaminyldiphosphoundecaprenol N-acetyl-beta-D-mannosaminyltransferase
VQSIGLEWLWRLAQEPRRLAHRYLVRDRRFLGIAWRQVRDERSARRG